MSLKLTRQVGHSCVTFSDEQEASDSVSEEEKSELLGVSNSVGEARGESGGETGDPSGEVGDSNTDGVLVDETFLLLLLGLSGVIKSG